MNMSYCMFENTIQDMRQVLAAMRKARNIEDLDLNSYELVAFEQMGAVLDEMTALHEALSETR